MPSIAPLQALKPLSISYRLVRVGPQNVMVRCTRRGGGGTLRPPARVARQNAAFRWASRAFFSVAQWALRLRQSAAAGQSSVMRITHPTAAQDHVNRPIPPRLHPVRVAQLRGSARDMFADANIRQRRGIRGWRRTRWMARAVRGAVHSPGWHCQRHSVRRGAQGACHTPPPATACAAFFPSPLTNTRMFWCVLPSLRPAWNCLPTRIGKDPTAVTRMASL